MRIGSGYGAYEDAGGAQGERLEDVGAAADAAVEEHGELPARRLDDLLQRADGRRDVVQLPRAVVGHDDPRRAVLHRQPRCKCQSQLAWINFCLKCAEMTDEREPTVFCGDHSLDEDRQRGDGLQPLDVLPAQGAVDLAGHIGSQP